MVVWPNSLLHIKIDQIRRWQRRDGAQLIKAHFQGLGVKLEARRWTYRT
jgi:hypothetical protein